MFVNTHQFHQQRDGYQGSAALQERQTRQELAEYFSVHLKEFQNVGRSVHVNKSEM
jgi:hypothetical protein